MCLLCYRSKKRKDAVRKRRPGKPFSCKFSKTRRKDYKESFLEEDSFHFLYNFFFHKSRTMWLIFIKE